MLKPENVTAIIDSREQLPLDLAPLRTETGTLAAGDYSLRGLEQLVAIERKSLADYIACCGVERDRFEHQVQRLLAYETRAVVIESTWEQLELGQWRSRISAASVIGSTLGWISRGLPIVLAGDHRRAGVLVARMLWIVARRRWRELRALDSNVGEAAGGLLPERRAGVVRRARLAEV